MRTLAMALSTSTVYMILLDKTITHTHKVMIAVICAGLWIYFRTSDCYNMIPRQHIFPVIFVMVWTYLNYYEPLFLPIGLILLVLYAKIPTLIKMKERNG